MAPGAQLSLYGRGWWTSQKVSATLLWSPREIMMRCIKPGAHMQGRPKEFGLGAWLTQNTAFPLYGLPSRNWSLSYEF